MPPNAVSASAPVSWRELAALLLVTGLALALRLLHVDRWSWSAAEATTWRLVSQPLAGPEGFVNTTDSASPLVYLALRWLLEFDVLRSASEGALRLPFVFFGVCTVPLLGLVARAWIGGRAALFAAWLLAVHPAHVLASQTAAPLVVAMPFHLAAITFASRGALWPGAACTLLAGLCAPAGWLAVVGLVAARLPARGRRTIGRVALLVAVPPLLAALPWLTWPVLVGAALAVSAAPPLSPVPGLALAASAAWAWFAASEPAATVLLALPVLLVFTAHGLAAATGWLQVGLAAYGRWRWLGIAAPGASVSLTALVGVTLLLTVHHGDRAEWRQAAQLALRTVTAGGGLVVAAAAGHDPLRCYLRPSHHRGFGTDPHPRRRVQPLDLRDGAAALRELSASDPTASRVLVLTTAERDALLAQPAAAALLATAFECRGVLPGPSAAGDAALLVWVARPGS